MLGVRLEKKSFWRRPLMSSRKPSAFLTAEEMELRLAKERERCDRYLLHFSMIALEWNTAPTKSLLRSFETFLTGRLRLSDEAGFLRTGGIGIVLPMTDAEGARKVLETVQSFAGHQSWPIHAEVYTYVGYKGSDTDPTEGGDDMEDLHALDEPSESLEMPKEHCKESLLRMVAKPFPKWKRACDIAGAVVGLIVTSPVLVIACIAVKATSRGPVFFKQMRCGQHGRPFAIYKLRTMVVNAEELKALLHERNERDGPAFKMKNDPRVTKVGRFLRKVGADELPQLVNVLKGDMSIVGPRPLPISEDMQCASWQRRRLDTKPGLTCTWQISKSRNISFRDWMRLDLQYGSRRSLLHDVELIGRTFIAVFLGRVGH